MVAKARRALFLVLRQRKPGLQAPRLMAALAQRLRRTFRMHDAAPRDHPVDVARADRLAHAQAVLGKDPALEEIGHRGKADVRMRPHVESASRRHGDRPHLVEENERAHCAALGRRQRTAHLETVTEVARCGNERCFYRACMGRHDSLWRATVQAPLCAALAEDVHVQVCVVGAGIAGLTTAYLLAKAGKSVALLDDGPIGSGMTQMTSGHLTNMMDDRYFELERLHGRAAARLAAESHTAAIDRIEALVREEGIECQFERVAGYLFLADGDEPQTLERELEAAHRAGLSEVSRAERAPYASFDTGPCLRFPNQAQFHPLMYLAGLTQALQRYGGRIYTGPHAERIEGGTP